MLARPEHSLGVLEHFRHGDFIARDFEWLALFRPFDDFAEHRNQVEN